MLAEQGSTIKNYIRISRASDVAAQVSSLQNEGSLSSNPNSKGEKLEEQLPSVVHIELLCNLPANLSPTFFQAVNNILSQREKYLLKTISTLTRVMASRAENISFRFFKTITPFITHVFNIIFQALLNQAKFSDDQKTTYVSLLFKKGDKAKTIKINNLRVTQAILHSINSMCTLGNI